MKNVRTRHQIEKDLLVIIDKSKTATSYKEIQDETGLTYQKIETSFKGHPRMKKNFIKRLEANKIKKGIIKKPKEIQKSKKIVIDSSITTCEKMVEKLQRYKDWKKCLCSTTINELEELKNEKNRLVSYNAKAILSLASKSKLYEGEYISNSAKKTDTIIEFCKKNEYSLLTASPSLLIKARDMHVKSYFLKRKNLSGIGTISTFYNVIKVGNKCFLKHVGENKEIKVINKENNEIMELALDDEIYVCTKKEEYITFAHYKIIELSEENNIEWLYGCRIYNDDKELYISDIYLKFIEDFRKKFLD